MIRSAEARWKGDLKSGNGTMRLGSGAFEGAYSFQTRMGDLTGGVNTNPEELIGAAHASCFSMALSAMLAGAGHTPQEVHTTAKVHFDPVDGGFSITKIDLLAEANVPGLDNSAFQEIAQKAKSGCPVSRALASVEITLDARLVEP